MLIFHWIYKQNCDFSTKMLIFHRFYKGWRKQNSVAAAPLVDRAPFSSHSNFFFVNVVKPMVLATFWMISEARNPEEPSTSLKAARTPIVQALFVELSQSDQIGGWGCEFVVRQTP